MVCSGYFPELWDTIFLFFAKYIYLANPKLPLYLDLRFQQFRAEAAQVKNDLDLRNCLVVRRIFAEIVAVLCVSPKRLGQEYVVVHPSNLTLTTLHEKLRAPDMSYLTVFQPTDPKELFVPFNELAYALVTKKAVEAFYWLEWVLLFEQTCKKRFGVAPRAYSARYASDVVWLFWDVVLQRSQQPKISQATLNLFLVQFSPACKARRRYLLYFAILLCCEPVVQVDIVQDKQLVEAVTNKCNLLYKEIKKNEV
jgi:hypothetical protein